ncbi:hypothetical protein GY45DRAFT_1318000 [Cubamyces sp. BRFM 1775]|nr:hypothetical protein GY45DRAFT_1318000 [Cubamyces sp. BRFM 1775]
MLPSESAAISSQTDGGAQPSTSTPPTPDSMQSARGNSSHLGAIIAGVVGGVVLLTVAVWLTRCAVRRRRRRHAKRALSASGPVDRWRLSGREPLNYEPPETKEEEEDVEKPNAELSSFVGPPQVHSFAPASYTMKLYDPDDPSTYPPRLSDILGHMPVRIPVNLSGAPEIYEVH